jgi:flagellar basal body-associated protein FliL
MPAKPTSLENWIFIVVLVIVLCVTVVPVVWRHFRRGAVLSHGTTGQARILAITDTGERYNTNPVVRINLMVTDAQGREYKAEVTMPVSPVHMAKYQPGSVVKVKYDPRKPEKVAIVRDEAQGD